jgi:hypothetical protein
MAATVATLRKGWETLTPAQRFNITGGGEEKLPPVEKDGVVLGDWLQRNL